MQQQMNNGEAAANLMSQMINAGVMQQTEEDSILVDTPDGKKEFRLNQGV